MCFFHLIGKRSKRSSDGYSFYEDETIIGSDQSKLERQTNNSLLSASGTLDETSKTAEEYQEFKEDRKMPKEDTMYYKLSILAIIVPMLLIWGLVFPALIIYSPWFIILLLLSVYVIALSLVSLCLTRHSNPGILPKRAYGSVEDQDIYKRFLTANLKTKYTRDYLAPERTIT
jgi:hypothetical protein